MPNVNCPRDPLTCRCDYHAGYVEPAPTHIDCSKRCAGEPRMYNRDGSLVTVEQASGSEPWLQAAGLLTESPPCEAFALRPTIADGEVATCPACVEFGTICRPCRRERYEARRAAERAVERRALRFRIWSSVALGVAVLMLGLFLQSRWDAQCAAEQPGMRWNGQIWACEVAR